MTFRQFLYDWNGLNVAWFGTINQATPDWLAPLAQLGSALGSYWGGPFLLIGLLLWSRRLDAATETQAAAVRVQTQRFALGFALAWLGVAMLKLIVDFPRPVAALPDLVRIIGQPQPCGRLRRAASEHCWWRGWHGWRGRASLSARTSRRT
jgi:signal peptidase II